MSYFDPYRGWVTRTPPQQVPVKHPDYPEEWHSKAQDPSTTSYDKGRWWFNNQLIDSTTRGSTINVPTENWSPENPSQPFMYDYDWYMRETNAGRRPDLVDAERWGIGVVPKKWLDCVELRNLNDQYGRPRMTGGIRCLRSN